MTKIFLVTDYTDEDGYEVLAAFTDEELAKRHATRYNCLIWDVVVDELVEKVLNDVNTYKVLFNDAGEVVHIYEVPKRREMAFRARFYKDRSENSTYEMVLCCVVQAKNEEEAVERAIYTKDHNLKTREFLDGLDVWYPTISIGDRY